MEREMGRKAWVGLGWLGAAVALLAVLAAVASPRVRVRLASTGEELGELADRATRTIRNGLRGGGGRGMAALHEISGTLDSATTQFESSMTVSKVASLLNQEPRLRGADVGVRIIGGILHLEGNVSTPEQKALAGEIARQQSGAELVANNLRVSPTGR